MTALFLAATMSWQCHVRPLIGVDSFIGVSPKRATAVTAAMDACYAHGHVGCHVTYCERR